MRTLSTTLTNAVNAQTRRPAVAMTIEDHIIHFAQQTLTTSANADGLNDVCVASDGGLIRVRITRGSNPSQQSLQWQRVTDPTNATQWQSWTTFGGASSTVYQDGGCALSNTSGLLRVFAQQGSGGNALWTWQSSDNGQTWSSAPTTVLSPPGGALLKGIASAGNNDCFLLYDVYGGEAIGASFWSGSSWSMLRTWTLSTIIFAAGLAVAWQAVSSSYTLVYSDGYSLKACTTNSSASSWTALPDIAPTSNGMIGRVAPRLTFFDNLYQLTCVEIDTGSYTGSVYAYPRVRQSIDLLHWSNGFIFPDLPCNYGAAIVKWTPPATTRARYAIITLAKLMLDSDFQNSDATRYLDVSTHILDYQRIDDLGKPGAITLMLDNSGSQLIPSIANYGVSYQPIGLNCTMVLSEGYFTGTPPITAETITTARYHIRQIVFERAPGQNRVRIEAADLTQQLDAQNRFQLTYTNQSLSWMITEVCARAGLFSIVLPTTAQMSSSITTFVLQAGQPYRHALDELCRVGWLEYFLDQNETLQFRELSASDASVWTYAPEIETLALGSSYPRANHTIVVGRPPAGSTLGATTTGEAYDSLHMHTVGLEEVTIETDPKLISSALCATRASFELQQEQRDGVEHSISVPHNPVLQLLDIVTVNDQAAPLGTGRSASARVYREEVIFDATHASYTLTLSLEGA